jgi:hypothetical protein
MDRRPESHTVTPSADEAGLEGDGWGEVDDPTVIFLHIGKTAGTTMRQILRRKVRSADTLVIRRRGRREETLEGFGALPVEERARPRLIMGHTVFGLHEHVPRPSIYITIVREPAKLVVSQYRYVLRTPTHRLHEIATSEGMSLADYIRSGSSLEMDNSQTRAISGDLGVPFGECTNDMLERAKGNIDRCFAVAGMTERFEETLILLQKVFGWSHIHYVRANVAPQGPPVVIDDETRALIQEHNRLDDELYAFVGDRFDEMAGSYPTFRADLERFKRSNGRYRPWGTLTHALPHRISSTVGFRRFWSRSNVRDL